MREARSGLFWTERISYRIGAIIAIGLMRTTASPNAVTLAGLLVHLAGASVVVVGRPHAGPSTVIAVVVLWQLAYGLDCADGLLARATGRSSPYGGWLDQVVDAAAHITVFAALSSVVAAELDLSSDAAIGLTALTTGLLTLQGVSVGLKAATVGRGGRPATRGRRGIAGRLFVVTHLTDYGFVLAVSSLLLLVPEWLAIYLVATATLAGLLVVGQLAIHRPRPTAG